MNRIVINFIEKDLRVSVGLAQCSNCSAMGTNKELKPLKSSMEFWCGMVRVKRELLFTGREIPEECVITGIE